MLVFLNTIFNDTLSKTTLFDIMQSIWLLEVGIWTFGLTLCSVVCSSSCIYIWFMLGGEF